MWSWEKFIAELEKILEEDNIDQSHFIEFNYPKEICKYCKGPPDSEYGLTENGLCSECSHQLVMNITYDNLKKNGK